MLGSTTPDCPFEEEIKLDFSAVLSEGSSLDWKYGSEFEGCALVSTKGNKALSTLSFLLLSTCLQTLDHHLLDV